MFRGYRIKLTAVVFLLVALAAAASSVVVISGMERSSRRELIKKGFSMASGLSEAASSGGEALEARIRQYEKEAFFLAVVDDRGRILAHSIPSMAGGAFEEKDGELVEARQDGSSARKVVRAGVINYEFQSPVAYGGNGGGRAYLGLDAYALVEARREAVTRTALASGALLALITLGVYALTRRVTAPMERLSAGFALLPEAADPEEMRLSSKHDLGDLNARFNDMARTIMEQKSELRQSALELEKSYVATIRLLAAVIEARDPYTRGHSARVARMAALIGRRMGIDGQELSDLEVSSMFHDVGKIRIPDSILNKKERLSIEELEEMMKHTRHGAEILGVVESLRKYIPPVLYHHEWYDGSGYPDGLKGEEIPLPAAIISVADAFDAMTSERPYRGAMSAEEALREMMGARGRQFDPGIVDAFAEVVAEGVPEHQTLFMGGGRQA